MRRILTGLTFLATTLAITSTTAHAQQACADRDLVTERLAAKYGESFAGGGLQNSSRVFEVWFSPEKGTWTILMTHADGTTCIMASGTNWLEGDLKPKPAGIPS